MTIDQDVGGCEFWDDWYAVCNETDVNEITLISDFIVSASGFGRVGETDLHMPSGRSLGNKMINQRVEGKKNNGTHSIQRKARW